MKQSHRFVHGGDLKTSRQATRSYLNATLSPTHIRWLSPGVKLVHNDGRPRIGARRWCDRNGWQR